MRVTQSMYYKNVTAEGYRANERLFDVNKQIASGLKIQYAGDDIGTFTNTMRLDNELISLQQVTKSTESALEMSDQADTIMSEFNTSMTRMNTLLVQAANGVNDATSHNAIAGELRGIELHLKNLANTSINGQYLFSGSATNVKPIDASGRYVGNDISMNAYLGSGIEQQFNLSGAELFLGDEILVKREVTTNLPQVSLTTKYPDFTDGTINGTSTPITTNDTIRDLMGDSDNAVDLANPKHYFYVSGIKSSGEAFNEKIVMSDEQSIDSLLTQIGNLYGNTPNLDLVNVNLNEHGEIVIQDKMKGSSKMEFHMVGATDLTGGAAANVNNIDLLDVGENDFDKIILATSVAANPNLYVKEFVKSPFLASDDTAIANIDSILYDRTEFTKNGAILSSSIPQVLSTTNDFAKPSTKISEVADLSQGAAGTLNGTTLKLTGTTISGVAYDVDINLASSPVGSTFTDNVTATTYNIFNMQTPRTTVDADEMTYQQLMDVTNMVLTGTLPAGAPGTDTQYDTAVLNSKQTGGTYLSYDGKLEFDDINSTNTQASISLHDINSGNFTAGVDAPVMTFNSNSALTIRDPKTDFFKSINEIITSVEEYKLYPDATTGSLRNVGIENSMAVLEELANHTIKAHSLVGAQSNSLMLSLERTQTLEISTMALRSSVIDTDLAEASLQLTQLTNNFEAMLYTVGKVSRLSLVNYL